MLRERVSDDIYVFTSELYAQVTAGAIIYPEGAVLIDTLAYPGETREIKDFLENRLKVKVHYLIYTHYHADHTNGGSLFPNAQVLGHTRCRELLDTQGRISLAKAQTQSNEFAGLNINLPELLFNRGALYLHLPKKTLQLFHTPGHSADSISVLLKEDRVLFAGDMMMPIPHMVDGNVDELVNSLQQIPALGLENVVQGHGELVLRGEIDEAVRSNLKYLELAHKKVEQLVKRNKPRDSVREVGIELCGKSRIPLNGLVSKLHTANLLAMYDQMKKK